MKFFFILLFQKNLIKKKKISKNKDKGLSKVLISKLNYLLAIEEPPLILFGGMPKLIFFPVEITEEPLSKL